MRAAACALLALLVLAGAPVVAHAATVATTVSLVNSDGAPLAGAQIDYYNSGGSWQPCRRPGRTARCHVNLNPGSYTFQATWYGGSQQLSLAVDASHSTLTFHTFDVTVPVTDSEGAGDLRHRAEPLRLDRQLGRQPHDRTPRGVLHYELLAGHVPLPGHV